jgi:hypothetical protein
MAESKKEQENGSLPQRTGWKLAAAALSAAEKTVKSLELAPGCSL